MAQDASMIRFLGRFYLLPLFALSTAAQDHLVRETEPLSPEAELASFSVAEGFEIGLFAAEPMINKPINLAVDEHGRVWVSSTVEYPYAAAKDRWSDALGTRVRDSRDAIKILEDTDGDGRADKVIDFADGLNIPTGVLPWHRPEHSSGCIAWSIPNIWYFADTDGDGQADHREVLFGPLGYERDTHGMCSSFRLGADGWVYATHGFNNTSVIRAKDGSEIELHSGNVFRFRPDGSRVEVWSRGQVNPFGLAFDRRGNLYSADCHSAPIYQLIGGAVYPSFGKPHDGLGFGPTMIEHSHGSTGIAGIVFLDRRTWGQAWDDHILIGNPVTSRVNLDHIHFTGTTPRAEEKPDFIVSDDPWFRPVDLALAPDGALFVADFYNRIIGHYEVPLDHPGRDRERGRIWRIVRKGETAKPEPFSPPATPANLVAALTSLDPWERRRAAAGLVDAPAIEATAPLLVALAETPPEDTHLRHTLRVAMKSCLSQPDAFTAVGENWSPEIASVALAVHTPEAARWLLEFPQDGSLPEDFAEQRRGHIARHGEAEAIVALLRQETTAAENRELRDQARIVAEMAEAYEERHGVLRDPALLAETGGIAHALLSEEESSELPVWRVEGDDSGWETQPRQRDDGAEISVLSSLVRGAEGAEQRTGTLLSKNFAMPTRLAFRLCGHRGRPGAEPHEKNLVRLVDAKSGEELARAYPPRHDQATLVEWHLPDSVGREVRIEVVDGDDGPAYAWLAVGEFEGVSLPVGDFRADNLRAALLQRLARLLATSAPIDLRDRLKPYLPAPPPAPPLEVTAEERARLDQLVADRVASFDADAVDLRKGGALFTVHCAACHRVAGEGQLIGPQLDGIGSRGLARLAEDILDPNRNVDAHFRLTAITKKDGAVVAGFVAAESGQVVHLLDAAGQSHRILKGEIEKSEASAVSLMPAIYDEALKPEEFRDLAGWLLGK
jgi:putative heme-binding domain-containing protein